MTRTVAEAKAERPAALRCMICSCPDLHPAFFLPELAVHTCPRCGHGTTEYAQAITDTQARFSEARWTENRDMLQSAVQWGAKQRYEELLEFSPGHKILEVGCGTGEFLSHARKAGHSVIGLDMSAEAVRYVRGRYPDMDIRCESLETAGLPPASFDVVAAFHVLEHVSDPIGLLRQMEHLVRPGGLVYVRVPNLDCWYRRVLGRNWWNFSVAHLGHFTAVSLRIAFTQAGLGVAAVRSGNSGWKYSYWPVLPLLLARGAVMHSVGNAVRPPTDARRAGEPADARRIAMKRSLLAAYMGYRCVGSVLTLPLSRLELRYGGASELVAVGRRADG